MKFVVYEVWTCARVVDGESEEQVLLDHQPVPVDGMELCNWHAVATEETEEVALLAVPGLTLVKEKP